MTDAVQLGLIGLAGSIIVSLFAYLTARLSRVAKQVKEAVAEAKVVVVETKAAVVETKIAIVENRVAIVEAKEKVADVALDAKRDIAEQNKSLDTIQKHTNGTLSAMTELAKQNARDSEILRNQVERLLAVQKANGKETQVDA